MTKLVRQKDANGCVVASMAMVAGKTYDEARADEIFAELADDASGCSFREAEAYLLKHGYSWQCAWRCGPPGNTYRPDWPPEPWADVHVCEVRTGQAHSVVMLRDGTVLDPLCDEPKRLTDYAEIYSVRAVYRIALVDEIRAARDNAERLANGLRDQLPITQPEALSATQAIQRLIDAHHGPMLTEEEHAAGYGQSASSYREGLYAALAAVKLALSPHASVEAHGNCRDERCRISGCQSLTPGCFLSREPQNCSHPKEK